MGGGEVEKTSEGGIKEQWRDGVEVWGRGVQYQNTSYCTQYPFPLVHSDSWTREVDSNCTVHVYNINTV